MLDVYSLPWVGEGAEGGWGKSDGAIMRRTYPEGVGHAAGVLRKKMTPAEMKLWHSLKNRRMSGYKFRRQVPYDYYILDFCCEDAKLIVEVDGNVHREQRDEDAVRDAYFASKGYRILRFSNAEVLTGIDLVLDRIRQFLGNNPILIKLCSALLNSLNPSPT